MPLQPGRLPFFRKDGRNILFSMEDDGSHVVCAVSIEYLVVRAYSDKVLNRKYQDLFDHYRAELEGLASMKYDAGCDEPVISLSDLSREQSH